MYVHKTAQAQNCALVGRVRRPDGARYREERWMVRRGRGRGWEGGGGGGGGGRGRYVPRNNRTGSKVLLLLREAGRAVLDEAPRARFTLHSLLSSVSLCRFLFFPGSPSSSYSSVNFLPRELRSFAGNYSTSGLSEHPASSPHRRASIPGSMFEPSRGHPYDSLSLEVYIYPSFGQNRDRDRDFGRSTSVCGSFDFRPRDFHRDRSFEAPFLRASASLSLPVSPSVLHARRARRTRRIDSPARVTTRRRPFPLAPLFADRPTTKYRFGRIFGVTDCRASRTRSDITRHGEISADWCGHNFTDGIDRSRGEGAVLLFLSLPFSTIVFVRFELKHLFCLCRNNRCLKLSSLG